MTEFRLMRELESRLQAVAEQVRPHILHVHSPVLNAIPALRVGKRLGIPVVYEVRAFWEDAAVDHGTTTEGSLRYRATRRLETYALRTAQHVFTICEGLRRDIAERGISPDKITVIPNAVDVESFKVSGSADVDLKAQLGMGSSVVVGFIGSFYGYEGLDVLVEALPQILRQRNDVRLLFAGGGPQEAALKIQAERLGVANKVVFAGRVPHEDVSRYYNVIDVLAYPRRSMRLTELVTPLKPLEAMALGRLVIASDVGGHRELIADGITGSLFKAGSVNSLSEKLLLLLSDERRWPQLRAQARTFVEEHRNWQTSVGGYAPVYERLVAGALSDSIARRASGSARFRG